MHPFIQKADSVLGASRSLARVSSVVGADKPAAPNTFSEYLRRLHLENASDVDDGLGTVGGAAVGYYVNRHRHPFLGAIGGGSLGRNLPALLHADKRKVAIANMATTAAGILGARMLRKNSIVGFVGGWIAGNLFTQSLR